MVRFCTLVRVLNISIVAIMNVIDFAFYLIEELYTSTGLLPKSLKGWHCLLELTASKEFPCGTIPGSDTEHHTCAPVGVSDWTPDLTWESVMQLALGQLGAGHTVDILRSLSCPTPTLDSQFYYKCVAGAVIEKKQRLWRHP